MCVFVLGLNETDLFWASPVYLELKGLTNTSICFPFPVRSTMSGMFLFIQGRLNVKLLDLVNGSIVLHNMLDFSSVFTSWYMPLIV